MVCDNNWIYCNLLPGLAETCNNPEIKKLIDEKIDPSVGTQLAEKKIKMQTKELIDLISKPGLNESSR